ncbi:MAG: hypothetical protein CML06_12705 [Pseudomonadales bacterium]|nr:hypothetical protein [Pseudomonadales bacterium]
MNTRFPRIRHHAACGALGAILLGSGCVTVESDSVSQLDPYLRQSSVVSTSSPEFAPQPGATVGWDNDLSVHGAEGTDLPVQLVTELKTRIDAELVAKGYAFTPPGVAPDYHIHGLILLGDQLNEHELGDLLGFQPGLVAHGQRYEKGSLLLMLVNPATLGTDWRAAVQVFTDRNLTQEQQQTRFDYLVHSLLRPLPSLEAEQP